jgi:AcrR family transcriptional regulator
MRSASDLTARARIRGAALARFGTDGIAGTSVRAVAADAGVSPLVVHHFGSKEGLRQACDDYVLDSIRNGGEAASEIVERTEAWLAAGEQEGWVRGARAGLEMLTHGLFADDRWLAAFTAIDERTRP